MGRRRPPRCFGIGLPRTGTTSLAFAMKRLGYDAVHTCFSRRLLERAHFVCDAPIWADFAELDREFPGSRFIYTVRELDDWLDSAARHLTSFMGSAHYHRHAANVHSYRRVFRTDRFDPQKFRTGYVRHAERVARHFRKRGDVLRIDLTAGAGWGPLCGFLGLPVPAGPLPCVQPDHLRFDNVVL